MYDYNRRRKIGPATILFLFLFSASIVGLTVISYLDRGRFWDMLPFFCIPIIVLSLILAIYNLTRRCNAGLLFILFFIIFTIGLVFSSIFGPFALRREAVRSIDEKDYTGAIEKFDSILENYPGSRYSDEAAQRISYAYYSNDQFPEALENFDRAIERGVIDPESLEVKDILQDVYFHIAKEKEDGKDYLGAAVNYMDSISILKVIKSDFPDTNEAFIARYKIPRYLFEASEDYYRHGDTLARIQLLEEIISEHPESDYYQKALEAIDDAYIERAMRSSEDSDYEDAIGWFLRFLENNPEPGGNSLPDYKINKIFKGASPSFIKNPADAAYREGDYGTAVFLYEILIGFYPDQLESILDNLVEGRILLAQSTPYADILQSAKGKYINAPELSFLSIINNTRYLLTAYMKGPENYMVYIPAGETVETGIIPGEYTVLVESEDMDLNPSMGNILFEEYRKYSETFKDAEEEESS